MEVRNSVRRGPGEPVDIPQIFSPARPGQSETGLDFVGQAFGKPVGFMDSWRCQQAFDIGQLISQSFAPACMIPAGIFRYLSVSSDICGYLQISASIFRYPRVCSDICGYIHISVGIFRYLAVSSDICRYIQISEDISRYLQIFLTFLYHDSRIALTSVKNKDLVLLPTLSYIYFKFIYFVSCTAPIPRPILLFPVFLISTFIMATSLPYGSPSTLHPDDSVSQTLPTFFSPDYQVEYNYLV